jgi:hypothetical protein
MRGQTKHLVYKCVTVKVNFTLEQATKAQWGVEM